MAAYVKEIVGVGYVFYPTQLFKVTSELIWFMGCGNSDALINAGEKTVAVVLTITVMS